MSQGATVPITGFDDIERFHAGVRFRQAIRPMVPLLVLMTAFGWVILTLLSMMIAGPRIGGPLGTALIAAAGWSLYRRSERQFDRTWSATNLELSPDGVAVSDGEAGVRLPWPGIARIEELAPINPLPRGLDVDVAEIVASGAAPRAIRVEGLVGVDGSGAPQSIPLSTFDPHWRVGRIGDWIRRHRPDLLG
jgi:hypothetical protein